MSLQIKRALAMAFNNKQSLRALAFGSLLMLPGAYAQTFSKAIVFSAYLHLPGAHLHMTQPTAPGWVIGLSVIASFLSVGYIVRIMRAEFTNLGKGAPASLPYWGGNPVDLIISFFANLVGGLLLAAIAFAFMVAWVLLVLSIGWACGLGVASFATNGGDMMLGLGVIGGLVASPVFLFIIMSISMMQAHYAREDRFAAVFDLRKFWSIALHKFWALVGIIVLGGLALSIAEALAVAFFPLLAVVSFYGATVFASLFAQVYLSQTSWRSRNT